MLNSNPQCSGSQALHSTLWGGRSYEYSFLVWKNADKRCVVCRRQWWLL